MTVQRLPWRLRDPLDRLPAAQAIVERLVLVSAETRLSAYGVDVRR